MEAPLLSETTVDEVEEQEQEQEQREEQEKELELELEMEVGIYRWVVLFIFCVSNFSASLSAYAFASVAKQSSKWFDVSYNAINLIGVLGLALPMTTYVFGMWMADTAKLYKTFLFSVVPTAILRWLRVMYPGPGREAYYVLILTQAIVALLGPFMICLVGAISNQLFPSHERAIATSLATLSQLLGIGMGMVLSPGFEDDFPLMFKIHAWSITIPLLLSLPIFYYGETRLRVFGKNERRDKYSLNSPSSDSTSTVSMVDEYEQIGIRPLTQTEGASVTPLLDEHQNVENGNHANDVEQESRLYQEDSNMLVPRSEADLISNNSIWWYLEMQMEALCNPDFVMLLIGVGMVVGAMNAWLTLSNESAPSSMSNESGAQMISIVFFGFGTIGAIAQGLLLDRYRNYLTIARLCLGLASPFTFIAAMGWYKDIAWVVYVGLAGTGLFGFGMLSLAIEFGVELCFKPGVNLSGTIGGMVQLSTNIFGIIFIVGTTPGNLHWVTAPIDAFIWGILELIGAIIISCAVRPNYKRLAYENLQEQRQQ